MERSRTRRNFILVALIVSAGQSLGLCPTFSRDHGTFTIENGQYSEGGYSIGTRVSMHCDPFYEQLYGITVAYCRDGGWSSMPGCDRYCDPVTINDHVRVNSISTYPFSVIRFTCEDGYSLIGESSTTCISGHWTPGPPSCVPTFCRAFDMSHGTFVFEHNTTSNATVGTTVRVSCTPPYQPRYGYTYITCVDNINVYWYPRTPGCGLGCPTLPTLPHLLYSTLDQFPGTSVSFSCDNGYRLNGTAAYAACTDGMWTASANCVYIPCDPIAPSPHRTQFFLTGDGVRIGSVVTFHCELGWRVVGFTQSICSAGGTWSATFPYCVRVSCPEIETSTHLVVSSTEGNFGDVVTFSCSGGWHLVGVSQLTCTTSGHWDNITPYCVGSAYCPPVNTSFGSFSFVDNTSLVLNVGTSVTLNSCDGFDYLQPVNRVTYAHCNTGGEWNPQSPQCARPCRSLPHVAHVLQNTSLVYPGVWVGFYCEVGYQLSGPPNITCDDGTWRGNILPNCLRPVCPYIIISTVPHLNTAGGLPSKLVVNTTARFYCDHGWRLNGSSVITCQPNQTWSSELPHCELQVCPSFNTSHGTFLFQYNSTQDLTPGTQVTTQCDEGFGAYKGATIATCLESANYTWFSGTPGCGRFCPPFSIGPDIRMSTLAPFFPGTVIYFSCGRSTSRLVGTNTTLCLPGGRWSLPPPYCELQHENATASTLPATSPGINCQLFDSDSGHLEIGGEGVDPLNLVPGTEGTLLCNNGMKPVGNNENYRCRRDGNWSPYQPPECGYPCPELLNIHQYVRVNTTDTYPGVVVRLYCLGGSELYGNEVLSCIPSEGRWDLAPPVCIEEGKSHTFATEHRSSVGGGVVAGSVIGVVLLMVLVIGGIVVATVVAWRYMSGKRMRYHVTAHAVDNDKEDLIMT